MRFFLKSTLTLSTFIAAALALEGTARATNVTEFPDNGSEQMARGGAWVARASDPLAAFYNPAGLAGQPTRLTLQSNITFSHTCFTRVLAANDTTIEPLADPGTRQFPRVCNDIAPFPDPQLAFNYRATERIGIGFAVLGPSASGKADWPAFVNNANGAQPAPQRYLLLSSNLLFLTPTIAIGAEVANNFRIGASFQWGIVKAKFATGAASVNDENENPRSNDIAATIILHDYFVPGFTLGTIYSPSDNLDVAGWYKWSDSIRASGDVYTQANYFTQKVADGNTSGVKDGDSTSPDCGVTGGASVCSKDSVKLKLDIPMEAKIGLRYHKPRGEVKARVRDPMATDVFDAEVDLAWANNSAIDNLQVRFPGDAKGGGVIPVNGIPSGLVPPNADVRHHFKDVLGVRVGGDFNAVPDKLALRAGAFLETAAADKQFQNIDFVASQKIGLAVGGTVRIHLDKESSRALELSLGLMHVFVAEQSNKDPNASGLAGLAGTACNPQTNDQPGDACKNGAPKYRTNWPVNLGTITNALNVINVGASYRF